MAAFHRADPLGIENGSEGSSRAKSSGCYHQDETVLVRAFGERSDVPGFTHVVGPSSI